MFVPVASYEREEARSREREKADKERRENLEIARVGRYWFSLLARRPRKDWRSSGGITVSDRGSCYHRTQHPGPEIPGCCVCERTRDFDFASDRQ